MARLSAENSARPSTPTPKSNEKQSRFKRFLKGGHSRSTLTPGSDNEEGATIAAPSGSLALNQTRLSQASDIKGKKAMGAQDIALQDGGLTHATKLAKQGEDQLREKEVADARAEPLRRAGEDSSSEDFGAPFVDTSLGLVLHPALRPLVHPEEPWENVALDATRSVLSLSPVSRTTVDDERTSTNDIQRAQIEDKIVDDTNHPVLDNEAQERMVQEMTSAIDMHEFRFHRGGLADVNNSYADNNAQLTAADRIRSRIFATLGTTPPTTTPTPKVAKLGPYRIQEDSVAASLQKIISALYLTFVVVEAMKGLQSFFMAAWKFAVVLGAYDGFRRLMDWDGEDSYDVLLSPAKKVMTKAKEQGFYLLAACIEVVTHAVVAALKGLEDGDL